MHRHVIHGVVAIGPGALERGEEEQLHVFMHAFPVTESTSMSLPTCHRGSPLTRL